MESWKPSRCCSAVGFDNRVTIEGIACLCHEAAEMLPIARSLNIEGVFAGLRPVPLDGLPILGSVPGVRDLLVAGLHFGITLCVYCGPADD